MKIKSILMLTLGIITLNIYSQEDKIKKENIFIIAELTSDYLTDIDEVFTSTYSHFKINQIRPEIVISPSKNISCIIETRYENETKFGKTEQKELSKIKYYYNESGFLNKIENDEINIGNFGEEIKKENVYETNQNGISKFYKYDKDGYLINRYEIFYNNDGQIIRYDIYEGNDKIKEFTKTFEYETNNKLVKSSLVQNYENEVKIIPRRDVTFSYEGKKMVYKSKRNDFAEGTNSIRDFSKIGGVTLNDFINKKKLKITISDKSIQEIKKGILNRWEGSPIHYEFIFSNENSLNNWQEKKIFTKLYNQTTDYEFKYSIKREFITSEEFTKNKNIGETKQKIDDFIDGIYSNETIKTEENIKRFASFDVELESFCSWIKLGAGYRFAKIENYDREIVNFYKIQSYKLAEDYKLKTENKSLSNEELGFNLNELKTNFNIIVDQTIKKIEIKKRLVDLIKKNTEVQRAYDLHYPTTYKPDTKYDLYQKKVDRTYKNEDLYFIYLDYFKSKTSQDIYDDLIVNEVLSIQRKMIILVDENTNKLIKQIKNENDEKLIAKAILDFQIK